MRASYTREKGCWPLTPRCLRWCGATEAEKLKKICVRVYLGVPLCDIYPVGSCVVSSELVQVGQICGCSSQHEIILHFGYVSVQRHKRITYHDNYVSKNSKKKRAFLRAMQLLSQLQTYTLSYFEIFNYKRDRGGEKGSQS